MDIYAYQQSLASELQSVRDRVRSLVRHWGQDGAYKESVLKSVLRRHLPSSMEVASGFIVGTQDASSQLDIIVLDRSGPVLFRDGDFVIVTPSWVRAIVEVKTSEGPLSRQEAFTKLCRTLRIFADFGERRPWVGYFEYEQRTDFQWGTLLEHIAHACRPPVGAHSGEVIDCLAIGEDRFVRHWARSTDEGSCWRAYDIPKLSFSYFLGNLMMSLNDQRKEIDAFAWYPQPNGKESRAVWECNREGEAREVNANNRPSPTDDRGGQF